MLSSFVVTQPIYAEHTEGNTITSTDDVALEDGNYLVMCNDEKEYKEILKTYKDDVVNGYSEYDDALIVSLNLDESELEDLKDDVSSSRIEENVSFFAL